jgi:hypothetical protein
VPSVLADGDPVVIVRASNALIGVPLIICQKKLRKRKP